MNERLKLIYTKIEKLIALNHQLKAENLQLKTSLETSKTEQYHLKTELENAIAEKENLKNKLNIDTLAPENLNKQEIKNKIDQYISEIDRCIEQIGKL